MPKWDCFTKDGFFVGIVEADTENEAIAECTDTRAIIPAYVEERDEPQESTRNGKG